MGEWGNERRVIYFKAPWVVAQQLVAALSAYQGKTPLVLAILRCAVPIRIIADALGRELDVVLCVNCHCRPIRNLPSDRRK